jgi:hypothetical protein
MMMCVLNTSLYVGGLLTWQDSDVQKAFLVCYIGFAQQPPVVGDPLTSCIVRQDSDADTDYGDGYGSDLIGDEDDRAKLMAMNELEREMILADRSEARDREREKRSTALLLQQRHRETDQVCPFIPGQCKVFANYTSQRGAVLCAPDNFQYVPEGSLQT